MPTNTQKPEQDYLNKFPTGTGIHDFADSLSASLNNDPATKTNHPDPLGVFVGGAEDNIHLNFKRVRINNANTGEGEDPELDRLKYLVSKNLAPFTDALSTINASDVNFAGADRAAIAHCLSLIQQSINLITPQDYASEYYYPFIGVKSHLDTLYAAGPTRHNEVLTFDTGEYDLLINGDLCNINARHYKTTEYYPINIGYNCTWNTPRGELITLGIVLLQSDTNSYISLTIIKNGATKLYYYAF